MSLTRMAVLAAMTATLMSTAARAETFTEHFMSNWDLDSNGAVTLEEVRERRDSVFSAFDANEDGNLDAEERGAMSEMRDTEHASMAEEGIERPRGMGHGQGNGMGAGMGRGMQGHGNGQGMQGRGMGGQGVGGQFRMNAEAGMHDGRMLDTNGDGMISHDEFVDMSERWLARLDVNGDGQISEQDFR
ncbi:EF-hand domain-containing protein [Oricola sp.]|uniref:EF-hand domain-containing protein n=1 Tax=Oricola sp. TaxID=1979950 RepID=UPI00351111F5